MTVMNYYDDVESWQSHRLFAVGSSLLALILTTVSVANPSWIQGEDFSYGLWNSCDYKVIERVPDEVLLEVEPVVETASHTEAGSVPEPEPYPGSVLILTPETEVIQICADHPPHYQILVVGLLAFSLVFGLLAFVLAICGLCSISVSKKIYYFHSAGEIYVVCALSTAFALVVYPVALSKDKKEIRHTYGIGYALSWVVAVLYISAATCMCLDELVRFVTHTLCSRCVKPHDHV